MAPSVVTRDRGRSAGVPTRRMAGDGIETAIRGTPLQVVVPRETGPVVPAIASYTGEAARRGDAAAEMEPPVPADQVTGVAPARKEAIAR